VTPDSPVKVSSELWVQAVTNNGITHGMVWSIAISSLFAMAAVYVFTGSLVVMLLATITMVGINILVLGLYWVLGWRLGAIEGVAVTVLVGLSVDNCIHFSEAFVMSPLTLRKDKARRASDSTSHLHGCVGALPPSRYRCAADAASLAATMLQRASSL
jgi:predicted RND superfamily exporter protein